MQVINLPTNFSYSHKLLRLLGICFVIFAVQMARAQDKYERFFDKGKYGINKNGKKHVKAKYGDMKLEDKSDLVLIRDYNKSKWGMMDKASGKEITPLRYDEINFHKYGKFAHSNDQIAPYCIAKINNKMGIIDQNGKEVIPTMYDNIYILDNEKHYFLVQLDKNYGVFDINNKEILPIKYSFIKYYSTENLFKVVLNKKMGIIDMNNKEILPIKYEYISELEKQDNNGTLQNTDMYVVRLDGKYGIVDKKDKEILPIKYENMGSKINEGKLIAVSMNKRWGFLEIPSGKVIIHFNYVVTSIFDEDKYYTIPEFSIGNGKSVLKVKDVETKETVFFDVYGNRVDERGEPLRVEIAKNVFLFTKQGERLVGLQDKDGKVILKPTYSSIKKAGRFTNNIAIVSLNGKFGLINTQGKETIPCMYDDIFIGNINDNRNRDYDDDDDIERDAMKKSFYIVLLNGKYGIVNKAGKLIISPKFDALAPFEEASGITMTNIGGKVLKSSSYAIPSIEGGKFGLIDKDGNEIAPCKYDFVNKVEKDEYTLVNIGGKMDYRKNKVVGGKWGIINNKGVEVVPVIYEEIVHPFKTEIFKTTNETAAKLNGKWGLIDKQNKVVVPFEYQFIDTHLQSEMVAVSNNGIEWGFVDKTGKLVIPMKFKAISTYPPTFAYAYSTATVLVDNEPVDIDKSGNVLGVNEFVKNYNINKSNSTSYKEDTTPNNSSTQKNNKVENNSNTTSSEKKLKRIKWKCDGCGEITIMEGSARPQANKSRCSSPKVKNST